MRQPIAFPSPISPGGTGSPVSPASIELAEAVAADGADREENDDGPIRDVCLGHIVGDGSRLLAGGKSVRLLAIADGAGSSIGPPPMALPGGAAPAAQPFRNLQSYLAEFCGIQTVLILGLAAGLTAFVAWLTYEEAAPLREIFQVCNPECHAVPPWRGLLVANTLMLCVLAMTKGYRAEFMLFAGTIFLGLAGVITPRGAVAGFASPGNVAMQGLLILVRGVSQSGVLDRILGVLLGLPKRRWWALVRLQALAASLSAFLSVATVIFVGAPAVASWAPIVGLSPREALIPFVQMAAVGQTFLLISSSLGLIVAEGVPDAKLKIYDPAPVNVMLLTLTLVYGLFVSPHLFGSRPRANSTGSSPSSSIVPSSSPTAEAQIKRPRRMGDRYLVTVVVAESSLLKGKTPTQAGLLTLLDVELLEVKHPVRRLLTLPEVETFQETEEHNTGPHEPLVPGDTLRFAVTARGLARLRVRGHGLDLQGLAPRSTLEHLGGKRHERCLLEAAVGEGSSLVGNACPSGWALAACLAARRPRNVFLDSEDTEQGGVSGSSATRLSVAGRQFDDPLQVGDVLLLEAFPNFATLPEVEQDFAFLAEIPNSQPPRHGRPLDTQRGWLAAALLLGVVGLAMLQVASLVLLAMSAASICVGLNVVHRDSVLEAVNLRLFLVIASGQGLALAAAESGLASAISAGLAHLCGGWPWLSLAALCVSAMCLCNVMPSSATASLLVPIGNQLVQACELRGQSVSPKAMALTLIFSSTMSFSTPFSVGNGYVRALGPYQFGDYAAFGLPLQLIHIVAIPTLCLFIAP